MWQWKWNLILTSEIKSETDTIQNIVLESVCMYTQVDKIIVKIKFRNPFYFSCVFYPEQLLITDEDGMLILCIFI